MRGKALTGIALGILWGIASGDGARATRPGTIKTARGASLVLFRFQVAMPGDPVVYDDSQGAAERVFDPGDYHWSAMPYAEGASRTGAVRPQSLIWRS